MILWPGCLGYFCKSSFNRVPLISSGSCCAKWLHITQMELPGDMSHQGVSMVGCWKNLFVEQCWRAASQSSRRGLNVAVVNSLDGYVAVHAQSAYLCVLGACSAWLLLVSVRKLTLHSWKCRKVTAMARSLQLLERVMTSWKIRTIHAFCSGDPQVSLRKVNNLCILCTILCILFYVSLLCLLLSSLSGKSWFYNSVDYPAGNEDRRTLKISHVNVISFEYSKSSSLRAQEESWCSITWDCEENTALAGWQGRAAQRHSEPGNKVGVI